MVQFIVEIDGKIENVEFPRELKNCSQYAEEIRKIFQSSPKWIPGKQQGKPVRVQLIMPIYLGLK
jgi:protein TonB